MCGIAGSFEYGGRGSIDAAWLDSVRDYMSARGPDGAGTWISEQGHAGLAHRRLAIIDLSDAAAQPMRSADGRLHVTFNGEIYNYKELRKGLQSEGWQFRTHSDTEVLLALYEKEGAAMVKRLRGMFAFAIFDQRENVLFLARDPFGIKPLYYSDDGKRIHFASQVKALTDAGRVDTTASAAGHVGFLLWGHVPEPYSMYKAVRALPAGSTMVIASSGCKPPKMYFQPSRVLSAVQDAPSSYERPEFLHDCLLDSVRSHLVADVPVGVFLSAGLDSAAITALATEAGTTRLQTVTLGFDRFRGTENDETALAGGVAARFGANHAQTYVTEDDFRRDREQILRAMDQPTIDGINSYYVSMAARAAGLKVALSGLGGDEIFGGYPSFKQVPRLAGALHWMPSGIGRGFRYLSDPLLRHFMSPKYAGLFELGGNFGGAYLLRRGMFMPWELPRLIDPDMAREGFEELRPLVHLEEEMSAVTSPRAKVTIAEMGWYMKNQLLRDADWASMAHSLEIRLPFVDEALFRTLAPAICSDAPPSKQDMARAASKEIGPELLARAKSGFVTPVESWISQGRSLRPGLRQWALDLYRPYRQRRILALVTDAYGSKGGIAKFNCDLLSSLAAIPEVEEVVALPRVMLRAPESLPPKIENVAAAVGGKVKYLLALAGILFSAKRFDLVICGHLNLSPLALMAARMKNARFAVVIHGIDAWKPTKSILANRCAARADRFVAVSEVTRDRFLAWSRVPRERGSILPNSFDPSFFSPGPKNAQLMKRYGLEGKTVLMTCGRLVSQERYKGFDEVIDLLPRVMEEIPNVVYLVVGDGNDRSRLEQKAVERGVRRQVVFTGFIPEEEKADHYRLADVYVMPSKGEGFGIVYLEAMACGVPTIGSQADGSVDALRGGRLGILVNPDDPQEILTAIRGALGREKRVPEGLDYFSIENYRARVRTLFMGQVLQA